MKKINKVTNFLVELRTVVQNTENYSFQTQKQYSLEIINNQHRIIHPKIEINPESTKELSAINTEIINNQHRMNTKIISNIL